MAEEASTSNGAEPGTQAQADAVKAVDALFGKGGEAAEAAAGASPAPTEPTPAADGDKPQDPMAAYRAADGTVDADKMFKALGDTQAAFTTKSQRVAELEKLMADLKVDLPETFQPYVDTFDWDGLKEAAPKVYKGEEADKAAASKLLEVLHGLEIPQDKAHKVARSFLEHVNGMVPDPKTHDELRAEAVKALPNGAHVESDVHAWLQQRAKVEPFDGPQLEAIKELQRTPGGWSLLDRFRRQSLSAALPSIDEHPVHERTREQREAEIRKKLRTLSSAELATQMPAIKREWKELYPDAPDVT